MYAAFKNLALDLFLALQNLPVIRYLPSPNNREIFLGDLLRFSLLTISNNFDVRLITPLLNTIDKNESDQEI